MSSEGEQTVQGERNPAGHYKFDQAIFMFPDGEREEAERCLKIQRGFEAALSQDISVYDTMAKGIKKLEDKLGFEEVSHYKLFHLLTGSTLSEEDWKRYPLDTPQGDFKALIDNEIAPAMKEAA